MTCLCLSRSTETHALWFNQFSFFQLLPYSSEVITVERSTDALHNATLPRVCISSESWTRSLGECVNYSFTSKRAKYYSRENQVTLTGFCFCEFMCDWKFRHHSWLVLRDTVRLILSWSGVCMHEAVRHSVCLSQWAELQQQTLVELLTH